jgi:benzoyl-CoA reductase/2-hydroxyglutaryl-CoA dehydratase subunit BcrC/BadD/HgdB
MADDKSQRAPQDAARINIHEDYEVQYWTKALGVSKERLAELVTKHGVSAEKVREALGKAQA